MSERNNSNKKIIVIEKIQKEICSAHFPFSPFAKNQLHKISHSHCEFVGLSAGTVITKETN